MFCIFYALLFCCAIPQTESDSAPNERSLYSQAAAAIESGRAADAIVLLESLQENYPNAQPTLIAIPHLAECYLIDNRPTSALNTLEPHLSQDPSEHIFQLVVLSCRALPETAEGALRIERCLARLPGNDEGSSRAHDALLTELARRYEALHEFDSAIASLSRIQSESHGIDARFRLPLAWAHHEMLNENSLRAIELLEPLLDANITEQQQAAVRFELAEALAKQGKLEEALTQFVELSELARVVTATGGQPPLWEASVELRRAELLLRTRRTRDAMKILKNALKAYPNFVKVHEYHFLLARCAIADVEFDTAKEHLQTVIDSQLAAGRESVARALWLQGELHFLQREFRDALQLYQRAIEYDDCPEWRARGLLQSGKCHELLGQPLEALVVYRRLRQGYSGETTTQAVWAEMLCMQADERIALLNLEQNDLR